MAASQNVQAEATLQRLRACGIEERLETHPEALTVDAWAPFHEKFSRKSLLTRCFFLKDKKKNFFLVVTLASTKVDMKALAKAIGAKEPRFAPADALEETLKVSQGAVNPFAIALDTENKVQLVLDEKLATSPELLCFHPMDNSKTVMVTVEELKKFLESVDRKFVVANVEGSGEPAPAAAPAAKKEKPQKKEEAKEKADKEGKEGVSIQAKKDDDFAEWYQQVLLRTDMIEYYDIKGCFILRPNAYNIWKQIQRWFDDQITMMGVEPCYFPMFVSKGALCKEESHLEGFSAEVAWVTKYGDTDLSQHIAIRPTSETVMYPIFAKWIRSHRDLPLQLNQWCNVVRWEFSHATPFIRTREFLWQEGHTAHPNEESATKEVYAILDLYRRVYEELLAVPVQVGRKTEKEKFAGSYFTTTTEAFVPTVGRSVQAATSHCLGTNFAHMFGITYEDVNGKQQHVWQNSWGLSTRSIGVLVMVHGDDCGLNLPPRVAPIQVVIVPCGITNQTSKEEAATIRDKCAELEKLLTTNNVRAKADLRENVNPGNKYNHWEMRGVPCRLEVGPKDLAKNQVTACKRHDRSKLPVSLDNFVSNIEDLLKTIQQEMFEKAKAVRADRVVQLKAGQWDAMVPTLNEKKMCLIPFCGDEECEGRIKKKSAEEAQKLIEEEEDERAPSMGAKSLCIPEPQPEDDVGEKCFNPDCSKRAAKWTLFGRSY